MAVVRDVLQAIALSPDTVKIPALEKLLADKKFGEMYAKLIRVYVESGFNITVTSAELSYHRNTVKYHLAKVKDALGYGEFDALEDMEVLALYLALEAKELTIPKSAADRDEVHRLDVGGMSMTLIAHRDYDVWDSFNFMPEWAKPKEVVDAQTQDQEQLRNDPACGPEEVDQPGLREDEQGVG